MDYRQRMEDHFSRDPSLPEELNLVFARFEVYHSLQPTAAVLSLWRSMRLRWQLWTWWHHWTGAEGLRRPDDGGLHQDPHPVLTTMSEVLNHCPSAQKVHISRLNDYRPVALTLVIMKCFKKPEGQGRWTVPSLHTEQTDPQRTPSPPALLQKKKKKNTD